MKTQLIVILGMLMLTSACVTVRVVKKRPQAGGVLAVKNGLFETYDEKARQAMESNCQGKGFKILEEGEAVVGSTTTGSQDHKTHGKKGYFDSSTVSESSTTEKTEWRITYRCKGGKNKKRMSFILPYADDRSEPLAAGQLNSWSIPATR